jgi:hypothetical protein
MKFAMRICFLASIFVIFRVSCIYAAADPQLHKSAQMNADNRSDATYYVDTTLKTVLKSSNKHSVSSIVIFFEVTNTGKTEREICIYQTPLERQVTTSTMFRVVDARGREVEYTGIQAKRRPPSREAGDYIVLQPGQTAGASINLAHSFAWFPGKFDVTFVGNRFLNKLPESNTIRITVAR